MDAKLCFHCLHLALFVFCEMLSRFFFLISIFLHPFGLLFVLRSSSLLLSAVLADDKGDPPPIVSRSVLQLQKSIYVVLEYDALTMKFGVN